MAKREETKETNTEPKKKDKKITVKFFLNKAILPATGEKGEKFFRLYMLITYNRKNTMLKSYYGMYYSDVKDAAQIVEFEQKLVMKSIAHERRLAGDKFTLIGLHEKYNVYAVSIHYLFEMYLRGRLHYQVNRTKPHEFASALNFGDPNVSFDTLYTMATRIYPDFSLSTEFQDEVEAFHDFAKLYGFPIFTYDFGTVIDWLDLSFQRDYRQKLEVVHKNNPELIENRMALVDKIVQKSLARL